MSVIYYHPKSMKLREAFGRSDELGCAMFPNYELDGPNPNERMYQNQYSYLAAALFGVLYVWVKIGLRNCGRAFLVDVAICGALVLFTYVALQFPSGPLFIFVICVIGMLLRSRLMLRRIRRYLGKQGWNIYKLS